jgi:FtsH-binding integral membrane protein
LIRLSGIYALTIGQLAAIAAGCVLAAYVSLFTASHSPFLGPWWLAVLWWFTFSGGLWYFDRRHGSPET